jgi:O-6-methylguanine DNA methyltransferase
MEEPDMIKRIKDSSMSEFQKEVLLATLKIPRGKTSTYKEIAEMIGRPKAYRAVGNALNKNPFPIEVPCHRITKSDGSIGGYMAGLKRKNELLLSEKPALK